MYVVVSVYLVHYSHHQFSLQRACASTNKYSSTEVDFDSEIVVQPSQARAEHGEQSGCACVVGQNIFIGQFQKKNTSHQRSVVPSVLTKIHSCTVLRGSAAMVLRFAD